MTAVAPGTATITAVATNGTVGKEDDKTVSCTVAVNKADSAVKAAPAAKTLTSNGNAQELVTAGTADGGTMQYALGTDAATAPTTGYSASIPTKNDAGTYYVWYMVKGENENTVGAVVPVTIARKPVTITAQSKVFAYNVKTQTWPEVDVEGLVGGDAIKVKTTVSLKDPNKDPLGHTKTVRFASSNPNVAKVTSSGRVTAVAKGSCYIYAYAENGRSARMKVKVK